MSLFCIQIMKKEFEKVFVLHPVSKIRECGIIIGAKYPHDKYKFSAVILKPLGTLRKGRRRIVLRLIIIFLLLRMLCSLENPFSSLLFSLRREKQVCAVVDKTCQNGGQGESGK